VSIGAWFVLSDSFYHTISIPSTQRDSHIPAALQTRPTILYFHGNAASRAAPYRVRKYSDFSSRLGANILVIDYRGFGDSAGKPSQDGLACDARAAWDWLIEMGAKSEDVLVVGHSLGTAVAARLAAELGREGVPIKGLVLLSPFSSMRTLLDTYSIFGILPIKAPLAIIPGSSRMLPSLLETIPYF
jgi:abhydrolase domain-containing protein 12